MCVFVHETSHKHIVYFNACHLQIVIVGIYMQLMGERSEPLTGGVQSRFRVICVGRYVCRGPKCVGGIKWPTRMLKVILGQLK